MNASLSLLIASAAAVAVTHTLMGPDHYLPFIMMARAGNWSRAKTYGVTVLCGVGHVLSSVVLGLLGVGFGVALSRLQWIESFRGSLAAVALILFGLGYAGWGLHRARRRSGHGHAHVSDAGAMTPWILFTIFVLGPCEPLIPLLMFPAAEHSWMGVFWVTAIFGLATIGTMVGVVAVGVAGFSLLRLHRVERYSHALAGLVIAATGLAIQFLGL